VVPFVAAFHGRYYKKGDELMSEERYRKWVRWLDENIYYEILVLSDYRYIFWEVQKVIQENPKIQKPSSFYGFLGQWYSTSAVMCIRRQIKNQRDSISLARLLSEIIETPEILSRERLLSLYKVPENPELNKILEVRAHKEIDPYLCKKKKHIEPDIVRKDLDELKAKAKYIEDFADRRLAHLDKRDIKKPLTFSELDECIDLLEELTKKYMLILLAKSISFPPTYQYDWKAIFREPWIQIK
jgi:hypothetical protein